MSKRPEGFLLVWFAAAITVALVIGLGVGVAQALGH